MENKQKWKSLPMWKFHPSMKSGAKMRCSWKTKKMRNSSPKWKFRPSMKLGAKIKCSRKSTKVWFPSSMQNSAQTQGRAPKGVSHGRLWEGWILPIKVKIPCSVRKLKIFKGMEIMKFFHQLDSTTKSRKMDIFQGMKIQGVKEEWKAEIPLGNFLKFSFFDTRSY